MIRVFACASIAVGFLVLASGCAAEAAPEPPSTEVSEALATGNGDIPEETPAGSCARQCKSFCDGCSQSGGQCQCGWLKYSERCEMACYLRSDNGPF